MDANVGPSFFRFSAGAGHRGLGVDFAWSDEVLEYRKSLVRFAEAELSQGLQERDAAAEFPREAWNRCAEFGIQGLGIPEAYGGSGASLLTIVAAMEALGYACPDNGLLFALSAQMWACQHPIMRFGTEDQRRRYLPGMADGSLIVAHAMSEPESGSDAFALATRADRIGDGYVLNGTKSFVTSAPVADAFVVFATLDPSRGFAGLCAFLIDRATAGLQVGPEISKMGLRSAPMGEVFLTDCEVGGENLLGRPGGGMVVFNSSMERERGLILASTVGRMERQLERAVAHARERRQFGSPIGDFQAVSHRIVGMKLGLETARLMLYRLAWEMDNGTSVGLESALVKLHLSETYLQSSLDALQVFGGYGYTTEYELEREVRDAVGSRLYSGTSEIQRNIVAKYLGL
jgi:alkylation response protein AidB-like acyl-CoA dehydrogenase